MNGGLNFADPIISFEEMVMVRDEENRKKNKDIYERAEQRGIETFFLFLM